jgi:predicted HTH domain antitoxin
VKAVNIRQLKKNPSEALRLAREGVVVVMSRDRPEAVLVHLDKEELLDEPGVRTALAVALFKDGSLSPGRAAKLAGMPLVDFMQHLARLGVAVVEGDAQSLREDLADLDAWLSESS